MLTGVSETALLTLNGRAFQARHPQAIIDDPMAIRLVDSIDFDFDKFGRRKGQEMALRSLALDRAALQYLSEHPAATVVALAEGLQTSFWRLNSALPNAEFRWLTVDFEPIIALRKRLLPSSTRITNLAQSALDYSWMDTVETSNGVFITAEGLLMYLQPDEAMGLITECAKRFPGGQMIFDLPPVLVKKFAKNGLKSSKEYRVPPMPFSLSANQLADLANSVPGIRAAHDLPMPEPGRHVQEAVPGLLAVAADQADPRRLHAAGIRLNRSAVRSCSSSSAIRQTPPIRPRRRPACAGRWSGRHGRTWAPFGTCRPNVGAFGPRPLSIRLRPSVYGNEWRSHAHHRRLHAVRRTWPVSDAAPDVFDLPDGSEQVEVTVPATWELEYDAILRAVAMCPAQALRVCE
ncbi:O-methyltransferase involved in polyketide biosynthesis [Mycolicibacterium rhodesiae NBB3]|uniref:O-methyltransferase involved in polyketide biosynthesis n=1 Tax=Mycolicibacterium rhodesiae (strain NBB3) TaxID=710685 RepID=G8RK85_MYCRN|nr:O-methyltransferase involved in polyketide biosynthesis [Mycolicibacterium rhodesiae NBB3]